MKSSAQYTTKVLTTGFVVLMIMSILMFWLLKIGQATFYEALVVGRTGRLDISPSGLLPAEVESEPNIVIQSNIKGFIGDGVVYGTLGLMQDMVAELRSSELLWGPVQQLGIANVYACLYDKMNDSYQIIYFDKKLGVFVLCEIYYDVGSGNNGWAKHIQLYAGPNGTGSVGSDELGRFTSPLIDRDEQSIDSLILFDPRFSSFFKINFKERTVTKGPQIKGYQPVTIGRVEKNEFNQIIGFRWLPPMRRATEQEQLNTTIRKYATYIGGQLAELVPVEGFDLNWLDNQGILVLTTSNDVFRLNKNTLELDEKTGALLDDNLEPISSQRLLGYSVIDVKSSEKNYGAVIGQLSADGHQLSVYKFGANGRFRDLKRYNIMESYSKAGGPLYLVVKYGLENMQPIIFSLVSYFTTSFFEAGAGHRALFLPTETLVGWHSRNTVGTISSFLMSCVIISPSFVLSAVVAWLIKKDAVSIGLPKKAQTLWVVAGIAFGISAGITYLLTKKTTLVTCRNCGRMRRPDMETCHRCGAGWNEPELQAVVWNIKDK